MTESIMAGDDGEFQRRARDAPQSDPARSAESETTGDRAGASSIFH